MGVELESLERQHKYTWNVEAMNISDCKSITLNFSGINAAKFQHEEDICKLDSNKIYYLKYGHKAIDAVVKAGNFLVWKISGFFLLPGTKHRTVRRKKRRPPVNRYFRSEPAATALSSPPGFSIPDPSTTPGPSTPCPSTTPGFSTTPDFSATSDPSTSAPPCRPTASDRKLSKSPYFPVEVCEDKYDYCKHCGGKDYIEYSHITKCRGNISEKQQRTWALNQRSVLATKWWDT